MRDSRSASSTSTLRMRWGLQAGANSRAAADNCAVLIRISCSALVIPVALQAVAVALCAQSANHVQVVRHYMKSEQTVGRIAIHIRLPPCCRWRRASWRRRAAACSCCWHTAGCSVHSWRRRWPCSRCCCGWVSAFRSSACKNTNQPLSAFRGLQRAFPAAAMAVFPELLWVILEASKSGYQWHCFNQSQCIWRWSGCCCGKASCASGESRSVQAPSHFECC